MRTQGIIGAVTMAVGGLCPLLRVPIMGNWNYFDLDQRLAIAFYILVVVGLIGAFTAKAGLVKFAGWAGIVLVAITLIGVYFKVNDSFGFLHFKKAINLAAGLVKYKWGWYVIAAGAFVMITVRKPKVLVAAQVPVQNKPLV
ncbi:hypothetical protein [Pedobacter nyackensis]|uniref:hypothetical protein n=1 Tax=Pedobacter nyackensis TaxID=475255 RepID=UPI00292EA163|nr:hypothetical protein [Pedobacter nyackensis]